MVSENTGGERENGNKRNGCKSRIILIERSPKLIEESKAKQFARYAARKLKPIVRWPWLTIVIAAATATYTIFAARQWYVMRDQLAVMQAEQRPWIQITNATLNRIVLDGDSLNFQFALTRKNIGKTPALGMDIRVQTYVLTQKTFTSAIAMQKSKCAESKDYPTRKSSESLMPMAEPDTQWVTSALSMKQAILDADADAVERVKHVSAEYAKQIAPFNHNVSFEMSGCIDYFLSSSTQDRGQTFFRYVVAAILPGLGYAKTIHIPIDRELVAPEVGMSKAIQGNYAQ